MNKIYKDYNSLERNDDDKVDALEKLDLPGLSMIL